MNYSYSQAQHDTHPIDALDLSPWPVTTLTDTTMYVKREHFPLEIFAWAEVGHAVLDGVIREPEAL